MGKKETIMITAAISKKEIASLSVLARHFENDKPQNGLHASTWYIGKVLRDHLKANAGLVKNVRREQLLSAREKLRTKIFWGFKK